MKKLFLVFAFAAITCSLVAQQWGLYTLYATKNTNKAYLVDTANTPVTYKTWTFSSTDKNAYSTYLIEGDTLVRTVEYKASGAPSIGGATGKFQKVTWAGTTAWEYKYSSTTYQMHHDICPLPNGNVLFIACEVKSSSDATQAGSSTAATIWTEKIIEVHQTGPTTGIIVWEWNLWDHLCQNYSSSKDNYVTSIINNPQLLNINYTGGTLPDKWHMNGLDYNEDLDQIVLSMHYMNSVFVIDHSTTTAQAASHAGGNSGKGGDFLYRWGNPASYGASGTTIFSTIHDAHWVSSDNPTYPNALAAYNNQGGTSGKTAFDIWQPPYNGYNYDLTAGSAYLPTTYAYQYTSTFTANNEGNSQQLPNGNSLLCNFQGSIYEISPTGTVLWTKTGASSSHAYRFEKCFVRAVNATLTASDTDINQGESVTLNTTATAITETSPTFAYNWTSSPAGFTSAAANPSVSPTATTTYYVTVTNNQSGCTDTLSVLIDVTSAVVAANFTTDVTQACGSLTVHFTDASTGNPTSWLWNFGDSNTSNLQNPSHTYSTPGTYTVSLVATNANGSNTHTVSNLITVYANPSVNLGSDIAQCGGNVSLNAGSGFSSYMWNGISGSQTNSVSSSNTYTVVVADSHGCTATDAVLVSIYTVPTVNLGSDIAQCGGNVSLNAGSGFVSYTWNGVVGNQTNTVSANNTYTVAVVDSHGCTASDQINVTIYSVPVVSLGDDFSICNGSTSTLNAGTGFASYAWNGIIGTSTHTVTGGNNYVLVATDNNGCTATDAITVTSFTPTIISLSMTQESTTGASDGSVTATPVSGMSPYNYSWSNGAVASTVIDLSDGQYCVTVLDGNGCSTTGCVSVTIADQLYPPVADFTANLTHACDMITVQFTDLSTNNPTAWTWDFGDGSSTTSTNSVAGIEHTYTTPGIYTVSLTVSNGDGTSEPQIKIDYIVVGETPQIVMSMTPESDGGAADGTAMVTATGGTSSYEYLWNNGATTSAISGLVGGSYCVTVTDANSCFISNCIVVTVIDNDFAAFTANETDGCAPHSVQFTDQSSGDVLGWTWDFGDGSSTNSDASPTHTYSTPGIYSVSLTTTYADDTDTHVELNYIEVFEVPELSFEVTNESNIGALDGAVTLTITGGELPYNITWSNSAHTAIITGLGAGLYSVAIIDDHGCIAMGNVSVEVITDIQNIIADEIRIFPNPTENEINIISPTEIKTINIYDITGKLVIQKNNLSKYCKINLQELQSGVYFIDVQNNTESFTGRIVKK